VGCKKGRGGDLEVGDVRGGGGGGGEGDGRIGADVWLKKTLDKFNGRGGGNAAFAQGQIVGEDVDLEEVMQAAKDSLVPSS